MSFYQPSTEQPQDQPKQGGYDFGEYNFSQQVPPPYGFDQSLSSQPQRRPGRRNCLLFLGCSALALAVVCGCLVFMIVSLPGGSIAITWIQVMNGDFEFLNMNVEDLGVVCDDSQAERFTRAFEQRYPDGVTIELEPNTQLSAEDGTVSVEGTLLDKSLPDATPEPYEAIFYVSDEVPLVGCIDKIEQISPEFPTVE